MVPFAGEICESRITELVHVLGEFDFTERLVADREQRLEVDVLLGQDCGALQFARFQQQLQDGTALALHLQRVTEKHLNPMCEVPFLGHNKQQSVEKKTVRSGYLLLELRVQRRVLDAVGVQFERVEQDIGQVHHLTP